jgi:hypothetical protein
VVFVPPPPAWGWNTEQFQLAVAKPRLLVMPESWTAQVPPDVFAVEGAEFENPELLGAVFSQPTMQ